MGPERSDPVTALERGVAHLSSCQTEAGSLRASYDGMLLFTPLYVFAHYATATPIPEPVRTALVSHLERVRNDDEGYGLHLEGESTLLSTVLSYVALRVLGVQAPATLAWIRERGGAAAIPSWGKYWLAVMGLYSWEGVRPVLPELWLQPRRFPGHPGRLYSYTRAIYMGLAYLYGRRWQVPDDPLLRSMRAEIFVGAPDWRVARELVRSEEISVPRGRALRTLDALASMLEPRIPRRLRARALAVVLDQVEHAESSAGLSVGPVDKALGAIVLHAAGSARAARSLETLPRYLYDGEHGLTMSGYESAELWDTTLALHALDAAGGADPDFTARARAFVLAQQFREDLPDGRRYYRDAIRGGWPYSTRDHEWPVSDCTAEALIALLALGPVPGERVVDAVDLLLRMQNPDGGWPAFQRRRAHPWFERLNGSEVLFDVMIDHSYVEPTASVVCGLAAVRASRGGQCEPGIERALRDGEDFLRRRQRPEGGWVGVWGRCFTYGTWFAIRGLCAAGAGADDPALARAVAFLLDKQQADGGWGESQESAVRQEYVQRSEGSHPVMTAWALLALAQAGVERTSPALERGVRFLTGTQLENGDWPYAGPAGMAHRTLAINYRYYRSIFPVWALAACASPDADAGMGDRSEHVMVR